MFGAAESRTSYIRKPSAGVSRLQLNSASNSRIPVAGGSAKDVRSANTQLPSSLRKKTSEELFREHKEAAIAWAAQRKRAESENEQVSAQPAAVPAHTIPSPPRQNVTTSREPVPAPPALAFTISPPRRQSLSSPPICRFNEEPDQKLPPNSAHASNSIKIEPTRHMSPQVRQSSVPAKAEVDFGPFSPTRSAGNSQGSFSPQFVAPSANTKAKESIFARFKKEAESEADAKVNTLLRSSVNSAPIMSLSSPGLSKTENTTSTSTTQPPTVVTAKKTLQERVLDLVGVSALKQHERTFLVGLVVASPVLIYLFEVTVQKYLLPVRGGAHSPSDSVVGVYGAIYAEFSTMTQTDLAISAALAVALTLVFDRNTRATDARIRRDWATITTFTAFIRDTLLEYAGLRGEKDEQNNNTNTHTTNIGESTLKSGVFARVQSVLSVFTRIPIFARFVATILVFGAASRVVLGRVVVAASTTVVRYMPVLLVAAVVLVCALVGFLYVRYTLRSRATRNRVVNVLASVVKSLLQQRGRAYPILYLYEEVAEVVSLSTVQRGAATLPLFSPGPISTPAVVQSTSGFLGSPSGTAQSSTSEPLLFGSPLGMSNSSKENLLKASVQEASASAGMRDETAASTAAGKSDVLEGLKLPHLWKEVQKAVETDRRIQRLELIMDGKKHSCWRLLTGNTQANI